MSYIGIDITSNSSPLKTDENFRSHVFAVFPLVLVAAVAVVGAVRVLTEGPVPAGVASTFVHVALTPAEIAQG